MNVLSILLNGMYQAAEGDARAQRLIAAAAQGYNNRMAEINRTEPVRALRTVEEEAR